MAEPTSAFSGCFGVAELEAAFGGCLGVAESEGAFDGCFVMAGPEFTFCGFSGLRQDFAGYFLIIFWKIPIYIMYLRIAEVCLCKAGLS